jgi:hypothetical protein
MIAPASNSKEKSVVAVTSSASGERSSSSGGMSASDQAGQAVLTTATRLASPSNKDRAVATIIKHVHQSRFPSVSHVTALPLGAVSLVPALPFAGAFRLCHRGTWILTNKNQVVNGA